MPVKFHYQIPLRLSHSIGIKRFIPSIFSIEGHKMNKIDIIFCDDAFLLDINKRYLKHNFFTDIITFDLSDPEENTIIGEIYISIEMVRHNAIKYNTQFSEEIKRVIFHGILHLCGYKDKTDKERDKMRKKEDEYLKLFHVKQL